MPLPERLLRGYAAFCTERLPRERDRYHALATQGQSPEIMIIGCSDSRVAPEIIFDAGPGELFVVRNVANLVPPYAPDEGLHGVSAALEFAALGLQVRSIVVLGHARCGGVRAFAERSDPLSPGDFIGHWISLLEPAAQRLGGRSRLTDDLAALEQASIRTSIDNLLSFPSIRERVNAGRLGLHGAYFDIADGRLQALDPKTGAFEPVGASAKAE